MSKQSYKFSLASLVLSEISQTVLAAKLRELGNCLQETCIGVDIFFLWKESVIECVFTHEPFDSLHIVFACIIRDVPIKRQCALILFCVEASLE